MENKKKKVLIYLLGILIIASFFRLWQLVEIPPGLYPDVAIYANDALDSLKIGNFRVFYPENNGREGLFIWLLALSFSIFGVSIWSIKITTALIGILTVLGLYLLTKELFSFNNQIVKESNNQIIIALLSSFFLAISFWHTNFSRIGFRAILVPFILVFGFYFLFRGFRSQKFLDFLIAGLFFGLGFYTYISYRPIAILFLILLFWWLLYTLKIQKNPLLFFKSTFCFLFFSFLVALPIGIYFLTHPQDFLSRAVGVSIFVQEKLYLALSESTLKHLGMFHFYGDSNWRHNFAGSPMLFLPLGILFLIGFCFVVIKSFYYIQKKDDLSLIASRNYGFLLLWFFLALLPGILSYEGIPHALRTIGIIPVVYIFVSLGGYFLYQWLRKNTKSQILLFSAFSLFLLMVGVVEFDKYFNKWGKLNEVKNAFSTDYVRIGNYLNTLGDDIQKYVIVNQAGVPVPLPKGIPMPAQTIMFIERTKFEKLRTIYLLPDQLEEIKIVNRGVIIPMRDDERLFQELQTRFPQGKIQEKEKIKVFVI